MAHPFKPFVDFRSAASRTPSPEAITILGGVALLAEAPADPSDPTTPMVVTVGGSPRSRVTGVPAVGQYRVRVSNTPAGPEWLPELEFHASDEGLVGTCDYYRTGTIVTALRWQSFQAFVDPIQVSDEATLGSLYPATFDVTQPGRRGRWAMLDDGSVFVSSGTEWGQLSGLAKWSTQHIVASVLAASHDSVWTPPGAALTGETLAEAVLAASADGTFSIPGLLSELSTLGVTSDALVADVGALTEAATLAVGQDGVWASSGPTFPFLDDFSVDHLATWYSRPVGSSGWSVTGGKLQYAGGAGTPGTCIVSAAAPSDGYVEVVINGAAGSNYPAVCARYTDENNLVKAYLDLVGGTLNLGKMVGGVWTAIWGSGNVGYTTGNAYTLRLTYTGTSFSMTVNGSAVGSAYTIADAALQGSKYAGVMSHAGTITFDNLAVH